MVRSTASGKDHAAKPKIFPPTLARATSDQQSDTDATAACQPMPVSALLRHIRAMPRTAGSVDQSPSILHALHAYIGDVFFGQDLGAADAGEPLLSSPWHESSPMPDAVTQTAAAWDADRAAGCASISAIADATQHDTAFSQASQQMAAALQQAPPELATHGGEKIIGNSEAAPVSVHGAPDPWTADLALMQGLLAKASIDGGATAASNGSLLPTTSPSAPSPARPLPPLAARRWHQERLCTASLTDSGQRVPDSPSKVQPGAQGQQPVATSNAGTSSQLAGMAWRGVQAATSTDPAALHAAAAVCAADEASYASDRLLPFLQRPYILLQQLYDPSVTLAPLATKSAGTQREGSSTLSGDTAAEGVTTSAGADSAESECAQGATQLPPSPCAQLPVAPLGEAAGSAKQAGTDSLKSTSAGDTLSSEAEKRCKPTLQVSGSWQAVLDILVNAGPQVMQSGSPKLVGPSVLGSGASSNEHDAVSSLSEDAPGVDTAAVTFAAIPSAAGTGKKNKRKRSKRAKGVAR